MTELVNRFGPFMFLPPGIVMIVHISESQVALTLLSGKDLLCGGGIRFVVPEWDVNKAYYMEHFKYSDTTDSEENIRSILHVSRPPASRQEMKELAIGNFQRCQFFHSSSQCRWSRYVPFYRAHGQKGVITPHS